jgi:hypothetical protein
MTPDEMIKKSEELMKESQERDFLFPEYPVVKALEANYWMMRAIYGKMK